MAAFGELIFGVLMVVITALIYGFGLSVIWNWYMPNLFGLPLITISQAIGLSLLIKMFIGRGSSPTDESKSFPERMLESTFQTTITVLVFVGMAWLARYWAF